MSDLPEGWVETNLGSIFTSRMGKTILSKDLASEGLPVFSASVGAEPWGYTAERDVAFERGTIVVSARGTIGDIKLPNYDQFVSTQTTIAISATKGVEPGFLLKQLKCVDWPTFTATTAIPMLTISTLNKVPIRIAPLPEQRRIVAKVDALTARTARARADLSRIPTLIARYKQRLLALAFSGELTAGWRATQAVLHEGDPSGSPFPASDGTEHGAWASDVLPEGWAWVPFQSAFQDVTDSTRKIPTKEYQDEGRFPVVDQGIAVIAGYTDREDMVQRAAPPYIVFGDHTRCVKLIRERFVQGADGVKVLNTRPEFDAPYLFFALQAVELPDKGYSRHMKFLRATPFPKCPLPEQAEIVRRIESAFRWLDRMAADHAAAARLIPKLDAAILTKAFRGDLVPQDPTDEPASVLLERIRNDSLSRLLKNARVVDIDGISPDMSKRQVRDRVRRVAKRAIKKMAGSKSRQDDDVKDKPYLAALLKSAPRADVQTLFRAADLPVADFYKQLAWEIDNGHIVDSAETLKAA